MKKIELDCVYNVWLVGDPFAKFEMTREDVDTLYLDKEEIRRIISKNIQNERLLLAFISSGKIPEFFHTLSVACVSDFYIAVDTNRQKPTVTYGDRLKNCGRISRYPINHPSCKHHLCHD